MVIDVGSVDTRRVVEGSDGEGRGATRKRVQTVTEGNYHIGRVET